MSEVLVKNRRRAAPRAAILRATVELIEEHGYNATSIEAIARRAGVGKQTIYRWWGGSRAELVLEAFLGASDERVEPRDTGSLRGDLLAILVPVLELNVDRERGTALANRTLMAEAQLDEDVHQKVLALHRSWWGPLFAAVGRAREREEIAPDREDGLLVDLILGACWYRLLLGHAPLDAIQAPAIVDAALHGFLRAGDQEKGTPC